MDQIKRRAPIEISARQAAEQYYQYGINQKCPHENGTKDHAAWWGAFFDYGVEHGVNQAAAA